MKKSQMATYQVILQSHRIQAEGNLGAFLSLAISVRHWMLSFACFNVSSHIELEWSGMLG